MLPLDETPFAIDANKRLINNPKIVTMQGDQNAEVVLFTIDRYFDFKDLNEAQIYVQWILPDGKTHGASLVELRDLSIPGKIRFGWPLDNEITSQPGTVQFSVRFWNVEKIDGKDTIVYSFNTQTSSLTITKSLQAELNDEIEVNAPLRDNYFKKAITNSSILNENLPIPLNPRFDEPGLNLQPYESLTNNTLTLEAQAINSDTGELSYKWWYKPAEDGDSTNEVLKDFKANNWYPFEDEEDVDGTVIPGFSAYGGTIGEVYKKAGLQNSDSLNIGEVYYMLTDDGYELYDGSAISHSDLYEKFITYTVPDGDTKVTGQYKVEAINSIRTNKSTPVSSRICQLVSPENIELERNGDLDSTATIESKDGELQKAILKIDVKPDDNIGVERTYTWTHKKTGPDGIGTVVQTKTLKQDEYPELYETVEPGWYQVKVDSTLNRETKNLTSSICKVAYETPVPEVRKVDENNEVIYIPYVEMAYGPTATKLIEENKVDDNGIPQYILGSPVTLDVITVVNGKEGYSNLLFSENLSYNWGYQLEDGKFIYLTEADVGEGKMVVSGLGENALVVDRNHVKGSCVFKCVITNSVNGQTATCGEENALVFDVTPIN